MFTRNYQANILHNGTDPKCRFCEDKVETIDHLVSGCSILTPNEYTNRHDRVGQLSKYKDLEIEMEKVWHLKTKTLPVVIGALGLIKKDTDKFLEQIPGNPRLEEVQKIVLNSTEHILRRALSI